MRNNVLRRLGLLLAVLMLLCIVPATTQANAAHNPYWKDIVLSDTSEVTSISVFVDGADGSFSLFKTFESEHKKEQKIYFERPQDAKRFYIEVTMADGTVRASEPVDATGYDQKYTYNVKTNALKEKADRRGWLFVPLILLGLAGALALPLGVTVLVEFLAALPFRLKPYKYVIFVNLITNPVMNVLLYILRLSRIGAWILVPLEIIVALVEFLFYTKKYPDRTKGKLLLFSIVANALSWGLYEAALRVIFFQPL